MSLSSKLHHDHPRSSRRGSALRKSLPLLLAVLILPAAAYGQGARGGAAAEGAVLDRLELRSIFAMGGSSQFSLHDPVRDLSFWISLGETRHGIEVTEYHRETDRVVVHYEGRTRAIGLSDAEIVPLEETADPENDGGARSAFDTERGDQRNPEERMREIVEMWEREIEGNPRLREIDEHMNEYYREFQSVRQAMWNTTDHDSPEFQELRERRRELREEMQILNRLTQRETAENPAFEEIDQRALLATLRSRHMQRDPQGEE